MRCLPALLMTVLLGLQGCALLFDSEEAVPPGSDSDAGQINACEGLSLIQEDFSSPINGSNWAEFVAGDAVVTRLSGGVEFSTGLTASVDRFAVMGTQQTFDMTGTLSLNIRNLDLKTDPDASFLARLDSQLEEGVLGVSIIDGTLSLYSETAGGELATEVPVPPFWLLLDIEENIATLSYTKNGVDLTTVGTLDIVPEPVTLFVGAAATSMSALSGHSAEVTQIGDAPGRVCQ